jgi:MerR family transcriptional regulator/heat shock protein HspR
VTVPTLDATVSLRVPAGTASGRTFRVKGRGVQGRTRTGDLLVTVEVAVPARLDDEATAALQAYAEATKGDDPRAGLLRGAAMTLPPGPAPDQPVFVISVAAELAGLHAQTLRSYDRLGLVRPGRSPGGGRRYSARDIALLREVQRLSQEEGVNLAGIKRIIELEQLVDELRGRIDAMAEELLAARTAAEQAVAGVHASYRRDLVPVKREQALVVWRPERRRT